MTNAKKSILFGLDEKSTNEEIKAKAFDLVGQIRFIPAATLSSGRPEIRILDFNKLKDGNLYFMTSKGKPVYKQLTDNPILSICTLIDSNYSLRLTASIEAVADKEIWEEFFKLNPGTKKMYRKEPDIMQIFKLHKGEGELFHLYADDKIKRARFGFGGIAPRPMTYRIVDGCDTCGVCEENCVENAIMLKDGKYIISEMDCDECGICYRKCHRKGRGMSNLLNIT